MKNALISVFSMMICLSLSAQVKETIQINVNANKQIGTAKATFNGANIEDLNNQTNGGVFSQLIHGEAFEENVDVDFLNLPTNQYVQVYVVLDETRTPHFLSTANAYNRTTWNNLSDKYDFNSRELIDSYYQAINPNSKRRLEQQATPPKPVKPMKIGDLNFYGRFVIFDSIPAQYQQILLDRINGDEQISRYWNKIQKNTAKGKFTLKRGDAYMGRQNQVITFADGNGEIGIYNSGLNKQGIHLEANKPYDGILRLKSNGADVVYLSLRDSKGNILAEKPYTLKNDGSYEKVTFELTPSNTDPKGSFGISLKNKGEVELGFVFLQPGEWGRVKGLPVRKMMIDALKKQGISVIRYNGSMVDVGVDTYLYRWKKMIGPIDERRICFRNGFNPYATHTFGITEMLQVAEALDAQVMIGMNINETYEDIRDFVEYVNGDTSTKWGALRAAHGHPTPYKLKHIQVHNEQSISRGYVEGMKKFAEAAWEVDPEMNIITSLNIGSRLESYVRGGSQYELAKEMFAWFISKGKANNLGWDPHYSGAVNFADNTKGFENEMGITLQRALLEDLGHKLTLYPMEENGSRCDWDRGLAHAHNWNTLQRYADCFTWLGTANTLQPHRQHYMWDQGRVHYTSNEIWFQPSAYEDEMMSNNWLFNVLDATSSQDKKLDVTAKTNDDKSELSIYVVNITNQPQKATINIDGYKFQSRAKIWTIGGCELTDYNTVEAKETVAPKIETVRIKSKNTQYTFPKYSYTVITLKKY
ncbi:hypothetical protein DW182_11930 [Bacteroides sp. AM16-24]|uniref:alpha-L-arabinofuranosidase C-terminal domain-containing protein n=1 Tax=Bacteroides sp. AM16-24 TaxID=2292002 RepID=UPI000E50491D|nr:alpha-L-arabinofuranosidase C-terminal domain-containing protein [Bacteroides sp. AM16-24]RHI07843.1 hypothetical protein DW182_11930 [Bacteroides sp. AM16-24]